MIPQPVTDLSVQRTINVITEWSEKPDLAARHECVKWNTDLSASSPIIIATHLFAAPVGL